MARVRRLAAILGGALFLGSLLVSIVEPASGLVAPLAIAAGILFTVTVLAAFAPVWRAGGGRVLGPAFVGGMLLVAGSVVASLVAPRTTLAVPMMIVAGFLLAGVVWAVFAAAWRTKGWSLRHPGREE